MNPRPNFVRKNDPRLTEKYFCKRDVRLWDPDYFNNFFVTGDNRYNTLNREIRVMLGTKPEFFDLSVIKSLMDGGATHCDSDRNNTLSLVLRCYSEAQKFRNEERRELFSNNVLQLIDMLIDNQANASESMHNNTLAMAVQTNNPKIVQKILKLNPRTHEKTLNLAMITKNPQIVDLMIKYGAKPDHNTLNQALMTQCRELVDLALKCDAQPNNESDMVYNTMSLCERVFPSMLETMQSMGARSMNQ